MKQYDIYERVFQGEVLKDDYAEIDLSAVFTNGSETVNVKGFYDGDGRYVIRFLPLKTGIWSWKVSGLFEESGEEECVEASLRGPVKAKGTHFVYADDTPYYPFGTTVYALMHQPEDLIDETLMTLRDSPFNKVRLCLFPKHYDFNAGEPDLYPFEKTEDGKWDVRRPCIPFWHHFERRLNELKDLGIEADLILFHPYDRWGFNSLSQEDNLLYLEYLLRRLSAYSNIWWSLANEYDLCGAFKSVEDFEEIEEYVASHDPYHHLLSVHNCFRTWDYSRKNITHVSIQSKRFADTIELLQKYQKPVIFDECCYEGDLIHFWGSISGKEMTARFWRVFTNGGYVTHGETFYDDEDVIWWAKGGKLKGESPSRIAFLRKIAEETGPVDPVFEPLDQLNVLPKEELEKMLAQVPGEYRTYVKAITSMETEDRKNFFKAEHNWRGHRGEDIYLMYYDIRTCARGMMELPENHRYSVELIDTWNMERKTLYEDVSGKVMIDLPGREYMAVLARRIR